MRQRLRSTLLLATLASITAMPGCGVAYRNWYDPGGSGASIDEFTYWSEPHMPQSVELIDLRTGETLFAVDIPPRQQLVVKFVRDHGEEDAWMPDLMKWELMPRGTKRGQLDNSMPVPPSYSRRLDVALRNTPEQPQAERYTQQMPAQPATPRPAAELEPASTQPSSDVAEQMTAPEPAMDMPPEPVIELPDDQPATGRPQQSGQQPGQMTPVPAPN